MTGDGKVTVVYSNHVLELGKVNTASGRPAGYDPDFIWLGGRRGVLDGWA